MIHFLALLLAGCCEVSGVFFITKFSKSTGVKKMGKFHPFTWKFCPFSNAT
nr:hypothetical protein [Campylobacter concisus]